MSSANFSSCSRLRGSFIAAIGHYDVLICAGGCPPSADAAARLVIVYAGRKTSCDDEQKVTVLNQRTHSCLLAYRENRIPIYGDSATFRTNETVLLTDEGSVECAAYVETDLGRPIEHGLVMTFSRKSERCSPKDSPPINAGMPSLELHIAFLRDLLVTCGIEVVEIPPVPEGFRFIACLTHDVDHPAIRQHKWDHTIFGFLYRADLRFIAESHSRALVASKCVPELGSCYKAAACVHGICERLLGAISMIVTWSWKKGSPSTFFRDSFQGLPGKDHCEARRPIFVLSRYEAKELADTIQQIDGCGLRSRATRDRCLAR